MLLQVMPWTIQGKMSEQVIARDVRVFALDAIAARQAEPGTVAQSQLPHDE